MELHDPTTINWKRQTRILLSKIPSDSPYAAALLQVSSSDQLLALLSRLLLVPSLTLAVAQCFRPLLLELCARWLEHGNDVEDKFIALSLLVQPHEELFFVLLQFIQEHVPQGGPLAFLASTPSLETVDSQRLHALLVAYYRILQANRVLPDNLLWSPAYLSRLFTTPHPDRGVRVLAIKCYALHTGMGEVEREKLETEVLGEICGEDCPVSFGEDINGTRQEIDGWMLAAVELVRLENVSNALIQEPHDYYAQEGEEQMEPLSLSPRVANIHGVLVLRSSDGPSQPSRLIHTATAIDALRAISLRLSNRLPLLLTSPPSSGKSLLLSHLASTLYPNVPNQIVTIPLADTSLDPRSLLGSYVSSPTSPGTFEWREGVLVRAMKEGRWVVFKDVDRASTEVLGVLKPLVESLGLGKWVGGRAGMNVPNRGRVEADEGFAVFATRSVSAKGRLPAATFFGSNKFYEVVVPAPTADELRLIVNSRFPRLAGVPARAFIRLWEDVRALGTAPSTQEVGVRELEKFCSRVENLLPASYQPMDIDEDSDDIFVPPLSAIFPNPSLREEMYLEARDVFFGIEASTPSARSHNLAMAAKIGEELGLAPERCEWVLNDRTPELELEKDNNGHVVAVRVGRTRLAAKAASRRPIEGAVARPFAMHRPAVLLLSRIATAVSLREPVLLTGETGTGKTSVVTHLAHLLHRPLISLNLSHQTESSDLLGGFKPVDARVPAYELQERFTELFGLTFSRKKNAKFEEAVRKAVGEAKWKRAVGLWKEAVRMAKERIEAKGAGTPEGRMAGDQLDSSEPRKRRKTAELQASASEWDAFFARVQQFDVQFVQSKGKFAFSFVEGPLVKALRSGDWILLDEINLASSETLECISSLLHDPNGSITLTEQGHLEPVPRHPDFRLFACMNPATDVGKKDLPPTVRSRFTEIQVSPPDADRDTLLSIVSQYIGPSAVGDKAAIMDVAEYYTAMKRLADGREVADGSNHRPHYSMRTLARALTFASDMTGSFGLRRALWEGCLMAFTMVLNGPSAELALSIAQKHLLSRVKNARSLLSKEPVPPRSSSGSDFVKVGPFYLEKGPVPEDLIDDYIMTPSVERKLIDLARIITTRRFPVLIEGPTSSGKTSSIEYLARRTGHRFVRINNHEHTDIQEYIGTYVPDPETGKLVFKDGLLVHALRHGHWIVLDELNLAPTDVLEALNRLLDDNRELMIPETQEVVRPHPHFMLFATQNPPGLYGGRKVLSRAFRNRFLEVHFEDVPQAELETILCQRCRIAPSYGQRIVAVFRELQKRRQSSRVFESKHGFATLRDLFRWAGRGAVGYQELANDGYMLLAERARREDDKAVVKEVIELIMKVTIHEKALYGLDRSKAELEEYLGCTVPSGPGLIWTEAMRRLFILLCRALKHNEPVLLVGETGSGKTSVCQVYAENVSKRLYTVNCHLNTETADLIGGLRPVRNRSTSQTRILEEVASLLRDLGVKETVNDFHRAQTVLDTLLMSGTVDAAHLQALRQARQSINSAAALFEWVDGPLVQAMRQGDAMLLDEISLADDSVLERLNSVLEPGRTIVLAEKGGEDIDQPVVKAAEGFKLVATMNPGGDYGKKELSPALRNRFTEIWVPPVSERRDLEQIIDNLWRHEHLRVYTAPLLDFSQWLADKVGDNALLGLRDLLAWTSFMSLTYHPDDDGSIHPAALFHHAAHMTVLDGLASLPQVSSYSSQAVQRLRQEAVHKLQALVPLISDNDLTLSHVPAYDASTFVQIGSFAIPKGPVPVKNHTFHLQAPTTLDNAMRVVRASQLLKPILLEGSPGVGKTSLVTALANICGYKLYRINFSDQSDLIDLFGSDLPVEGGRSGEFAWKDADFLKAMQEGSWVLLDEMNLAPQAVLEGLNAVLDHRGTVYIPELGRSFSRHPGFRIFAAQNPLHQGGGRKGLPKSFMNRFTKVYVQELSREDIFLVCRQLFPDYPHEILQAMISYNWRISEEVTLRRSFAIEGAPWEFNLRDVIRWCKLLQRDDQSLHPVEHLRTIYLQRLRTQADRDRALALFGLAFGSQKPDAARPRWSLAPGHFQIGHALLPRENFSPASRSPIILPAQLRPLEAMSSCLMHSWLIILTGARDSGKTALVKLLSTLTGNYLHEVAVNNATDISDILGSFEQEDHMVHARTIADRLLQLVSSVLRTARGAATLTDGSLHSSIESLRRASSLQSLTTALRSVAEVLDVVVDLGLDKISQEASTARKAMDDFFRAERRSGRFVWVDGPLVQAMKSGHWVLLDGANLCNPSVLDRLNSLCEPQGVLTLNEKGQVNGEVEIIVPHPNFRLFMTVDPQHGELSRAMRNRGIEICLCEDDDEKDGQSRNSYLRIPSALGTVQEDPADAHNLLEIVRRGLGSSLMPQDLHLPLRSSSILQQDSSLAFVLDRNPLTALPDPVSTLSMHALSYFCGYISCPPKDQHFTRLLMAVVREHQIEEAQRVIALMHHFAAGPMHGMYSYFVNRSCIEWKFPHELISTQAMDMFLNHSTRSMLSNEEEGILHEGAMHILHLFGSLHREAMVGVHDVQPNKDKISFAATSSLALDLSAGPRAPRAVQEARSLVGAIDALAHNIVETFDIGRWKESADHVKIALQLHDIAWYLKKISGSNHFDYSAACAVIQWIKDAVPTISPLFLGIVEATKALERAASPTVGTGLTQIWSCLLGSNGPDAEILQVNRMLCAAERPNLVEDRARILPVLALQTLSQASVLESLEGSKLASKLLFDQLRQRLSTTQDGHYAPHPDFADPSLIILELSALITIGRMQLSRPMHNKEIVPKVKRIIDLACLYPTESLLRLLPYLHAVWAIDANIQQLSIVVAAQKEWLKALSSTSFETQIFEGASILFRPTELLCSILIGTAQRRPLASLNSYETSLRRHRTLLLSHCSIAQSRLSQMVDLLLQSIILIISCFFPKGDASIHQDVQSLLHQVDGRADDVVQHLCRLLECTEFADLKVCFDRHLRTELSLLRNISQPRSTIIEALGRSCIGLSKMIFDLYVPDIPLDPAASRGCTLEFLQDIGNVLSEHIGLQTQLENRITGENTNFVINTLKKSLEDIQARLVHERPPLLRKSYDVSRVHSLWSEVWQFQTHVLAWNRVDAVVHALTSGEAGADMRERVFQESIVGFLQRLHAAYPDLVDMISPLELSLLYMRLGLGVVSGLSTQRQNGEGTGSLASALVAFPSIKSGEAVLRVPQSPLHGLDRLWRPLLTLSAAVIDVAAGAELTTHIPTINALYDQICRLWLIDRAKEEEIERASGSLYKKKDESPSMDESELQEAEFRALFPVFDDVFEPGSLSEQTSRAPVLVESARIQILLDAHARLFASSSNIKEGTGRFFLDIRRSTLSVLTPDKWDSLPETLDEEALQYQLSLVQERILGFSQATVRDRVSDFYKDSNFPQVKKAFEVLCSLRDRLNLLVEEWPDQMVLQHLKARCDFILNLELSSPVAKFLTALEQLLLQSDDWEMYANRENTLHAHRQALTALIVEWRRLELSSWQKLLESQASAFEQEAYQWWFRLYEAAVRGVLSLLDEPEQLDTYLGSLVPLFDEFISSSPLGQYERRMELLRSFASYADLLTSHYEGPAKLVFARLHAILLNTWRYFKQFADRIRTSLMQQRSALEKDINEYIKLASWKDVNVHALQQSARRTHHHLYKTIRKFRDILRQPIVPLLQSARVAKDDSSEQGHAQFLESSPTVQYSFERRPTSDGPEHLANLGRTYQRFADMLNNRVGGFLRSRDPHAVNDLTIDVIVTSHNLAATPVPTNIPAAKRAKKLKALLVRKRKAWSDLLKELKKMGFSANIKPEVVGRLRDPRWMREQAVMPTAPEYIPTEKIDDYLDRLNTLLPQLRGSLSSHHTDLTTRDLQRGIGFLDSALALALHTRTRLINELLQYQKLVGIHERLQMLRSTGGNARLSAQELRDASHLKSVCSKLRWTLDELLQEVQEFQSMDGVTEAVSSVISQIQTVVRSTETTEGSLRLVVDKMRLTSPALLLDEERIYIATGIAHLQQIEASLERWAKDAPDLRYLFAGVIDWLRSQHLPSTLTSSRETITAGGYTVDSVIETLLLRAQGLMALCPEVNLDGREVEEDEDAYNMCRLVCDISASLKLNELVDKLGDTLEYMDRASEEETHLELSRLLPFLGRYMVLVRNQLTNHGHWAKTLLKLAFVLCNTMYTVATQGFCQPPESEEDAQGEGAEVDESGVGMGQGSGAKDVSDQIEDESQVEGLRGEEQQDEEKQESDEKEGGLEMNEDFEGELEDVPDRGEEGDDAEDEEQEDLEEQTGKLDASDPSAVDEKLWGDEGPKDESESDQNGPENRPQESRGNEEMAAKQDGKDSKLEGDVPPKANEQEPQPDAPDEQIPREDEEELPDESHPDASGAPMENVPEGDALELPDDINLGPEETPDLMGDQDDDMLSDEGEEPSPDQMDTMDDKPGTPEVDETDRAKSPPVETNEPEHDVKPSGEQQDDAVAQPDLHAGEGQAEGETTGPQEGEAPADGSEEQSGGAGAQGSAANQAGAENMPPSTAADTIDQAMAQDPASEEADDLSGSPQKATSSSGVQRQGAAPSEPSATLASNPLRNLGEALKEIRRRFEDIQDSSNGPDAPVEKSGETGQTSQVEYLRPDDEDQDMEALGPAAGVDAAKLSQLNIVDEEQKREGAEVPMDIDESVQEGPSKPAMDRLELHADSTGEAIQEDIDSALTSNQIQARDGRADPQAPADISGPKATEEAEEELTPAQEEELSAQTDSLLQTYLSTAAYDHETAQSLWSHYSLLTSHLSSMLCEQLRLILEPTRATRLKGDYRTGKRLNMKKLIPYIASEYTKDKIWLRRTRPSEREYQVLLALDDSRSMRESRSVGLAFKTLALVSKALGKLEVGEVGIAKFGESVEVLHGFADGAGAGPFNDATGARVIEAFTFAQKATDVLRLVETSLKVLEEARERKAGAAGELWQLEIIISDGICQDHEKLRRVLRKAEEMKVMIVFVVLDSLHTQAKASGTDTGANANSILSMNQVSYKTTEDGRMELSMERYLDSFPFEYYVVLRDVEALPEVLSGTLKQFFERVSEE